MRLANRRVNRALKVIQLIGNLSDKSNYDYTVEDVQRIFAALRAEIKKCEERFASSTVRSEDVFRLE